MYEIWLKWSMENVNLLFVFDLYIVFFIRVSNSVDTA